VVRMREEKEREITEKQEYLAGVTGGDFRRRTRAGAMQATFDHLEHIKAEIEKLHGRRDQIIEIETLKRLEYSDALKDVKVLEKLKDKQREQYAAEVAGEERRFLDEVAQRPRFVSK